LEEEHSGQVTGIHRLPLPKAKAVPAKAKPHYNRSGPYLSLL
jgi:hypothetical protein